MPLPKELSFKSGAKYAVGQAFADSYTSIEREQLRQLLTSPDIFISKSAAFSTKYLETHDKYVLPATEGNFDVARRCHNSQMAFWQTQSTLRRGAPQQAVVLVCATTLMDAMTSPQKARSYGSRYSAFMSTIRPGESFTK